MEVTPEYKIELARELRRRQTPSEAHLWKGLRAHLQKENDQERAAHFTGRGYRIVRVSAEDVMQNRNSVLQAIRAIAQQRASYEEANVIFVRLPSPAAGEGQGEGAVS